MKRSALGLFLVLVGSTALHGQASPTARREFDLQVGGGLTLVNSDYYPQRFRGGAVYATLDFKPHFGAEVDFRLAKAQQDPTYEKTYEVGLRYHRQYGRVEPYAKVMYGRGVFNYVFDSYDATGKIPLERGGRKPGVQRVRLRRRRGYPHSAVPERSRRLRVPDLAQLPSERL